MSQSTPETKRLYVGGLFNGATPEDLKGRLGKYGIVKSVDLRTKKSDNGEVINTFAFIDFDSTPAKLKQCIDVFNKTRWKGKELKIQMAKESFIDRLEKERQSVVKLWSPEKPRTSEEEENPHHAIREMKVRGPPGTAIEGKEGWVVGKYSQVVPILKVKKDGGRKTVVFDPSKNCHALKRLGDDEDLPDVNLEDLTWKIEEKTLPSTTTSRKSSKLDRKSKKKTCSYSSSSCSTSEDDFPKTPVSGVRDDSDNESRGSLDTDEIVRHARSGKQSCFSDGAKRNQRGETENSVSTSAVDNVATKLVFSEFDDGLLDSVDKEREWESENETDDVFDLISSGQIDKLLRKPAKKESKNPKGTITARATEDSKVSEVTHKTVNGHETPETRKRKKDELGYQKQKIPNVGSPENKQSRGKTNLKNMESFSNVVGSKKRKRSQQEEEQEDSQTNANNGDDKVAEKFVKTIKTSELVLPKKKSRRQSEQLGNEEAVQEEESEIENSKVQSDLIGESGAATQQEVKTKEPGGAGSSKASPMKLHTPLGKIEKLNLSRPCLNEGSKTSFPSKDLGSERQRSLEILQSIVPVKGVQLAGSIGFRDFQSFRYDPSAADHEKFEINEAKENERLKQTKREKSKLKQKECKLKQKEDEERLKQKEDEEMLKQKEDEEMLKQMQKEEIPKQNKDEEMLKQKKEKPKRNKDAEILKQKQNEEMLKQKKDEEIPKKILKKEKLKQKKDEEMLKKPSKKEKPKQKKDEEMPKQTQKEDLLREEKKEEKPRKDKKTEKPNQKVKVKSRKAAEDASEVKEMRFSEVDPSVVDAFKQPSDIPFSLGALFGSADENLSEEEIEVQPVQGDWKKKKRQVVVDRNSDEEQEKEPKLSASKKNVVEGGFFYRVNDPRLKESKFYRQKDLEELRQEWLEKRPHLVEAYRIKKRKPLRPFGKAPQSKGKALRPQGKVVKKNRSKKYQ